MQRLVIDPVTRIEGHLRIDVNVDGGRVSKAWACCTMWRGIERILVGRDPTEAWFFAQRFCGVCTTVHALASVRAVEDALGLQIPPNAQYIRNLILISHALHDHLVHFFHLSALDWVDILTIPKADPAKAAATAQSLSDWEGNSRQAMQDAQNKVKAIAASGRLGIFTNGYWGHPAMRLSPEVNLLAFLHYTQALEAQRKATQVVAILGSKTPHIQNLTVGGVANAINLDSLATMNMDRLYMIKSLIDAVVPFVHQVYLPDVCAVAGMYPDWFSHGAGARNYLAVPDLPIDGKASHFDLPGGVIMGGNLGSLKTFVTPADPDFRKSVAEDVTHAWYKGSDSRQPWKGETEAEYTDFQDNGKYSWVKAPRYNGAPMEVGPLAQILVGYQSGHPLIKRWTDLALSRISSVAGRTITINDLQSTMGRHVARAIRAAVIADLAVQHWTYLADNISRGDSATFNAPHFPADEIEGVGTHEAPRGTLSHWVVVRKGILKNYQAVVPTTWNASPRDAKGTSGPYEASLLGTPVADPNQPLEVLRTVHSFDPCMACACHTFDASGQEIAQVKVL
jgi:hydrogenase large subunit